MPCPGRTVDQFAEFVSGDDAPIVVGGQAVHIWSVISSEYDPEAASQLSRFKPFTSKDCDVLGDRLLLQRLGKKTQLLVKQYPFGQATCCIGFLYEPNDPCKEPVIEVLDGVRGLAPKELTEPIQLLLDGKMFRTLNPLQLLKAKLANVAELPQENRQDGKHVCMLLICVRTYLSILHAKVCEGEEDGKKLKTNLLHCLKIIRSTHAQKIYTEYRINLNDCLPYDTLRNSPLKVVKNFCHFQLDGNRVKS